MKLGGAMAAAKLVAACALSSLFQTGLALAPVSHEEGTLKKPALRRVDAGQVSPKSLAVQSKSSPRRQGMRDDVPEQLETWSDSGLAVQSVLNTDALTNLASGITASAYETQLHAIIDPSMPSRFLTRTGNRVAGEKIKAEFETLGLETEAQ